VSTRRIVGFSAGWMVKVTLAAVIGILILKYIAARVRVPGLSSAIGAV
jgi:hypothetical protein